MTSMHKADTHYYAGVIQAPGRFCPCQHWRCQESHGWMCAECGHYFNRGQVKNSAGLDGVVCNANTGHNRPVGRKDPDGRVWQAWMYQGTGWSRNWRGTEWHAIGRPGDPRGARLVWRHAATQTGPSDGWYLYEYSKMTASRTRLVGFQGRTLAVALRHAAIVLSDSSVRNRVDR